MWLNNFIDNDEKQLDCEWIDDALSAYDWLFRFSHLIQMTDTFTLNEFLYSIQCEGETILFNYIMKCLISLLVNVEQFTQKHTKNQLPLILGYESSLTTWKPMLMEYLLLSLKKIKKELRNDADIAFVDIIDSLKNDNFFQTVTPKRRIELITKIIVEFGANNLTYKEFWRKNIDKLDEHLKGYTKIRTKTEEKLRDTAKKDDKLQRALHRSLPVHWTDFVILCDHCEFDSNNNIKINIEPEWVDQFYKNFFHTMVVNVNKEKKKVEQLKKGLNELIKIKWKLDNEGKIYHFDKKLTNAVKTTKNIEIEGGSSIEDVNFIEKSDLTKEAKLFVRSLISENVEIIFEEYINTVLIQPNYIYLNNQLSDLQIKILPIENIKICQPIGIDRYRNRYFILGNDSTKIVVHYIKNNRYGFYDHNNSIHELLLFCNQNARNERELFDSIKKLNINLTSWIPYNTHNMPNCLKQPTLVMLLSKELHDSKFYQTLLKDIDFYNSMIKNTRFCMVCQETYLVTNEHCNNCHQTFNTLTEFKKYHNDTECQAFSNDIYNNVPLSFKVLKGYLLEMFRLLPYHAVNMDYNTRNSFTLDIKHCVTLPILIELICKFMTCIGIQWRRPWFKLKDLKDKISHKKSANDPNMILLCLHILSNGIYYDKNEFINAGKSPNKRRALLNKPFNMTMNSNNSHSNHSTKSRKNSKKRKRSQIDIINDTRAPLVPINEVDVYGPRTRSKVRRKKDELMDINSNTLHEPDFKRRKTRNKKINYNDDDNFNNIIPSNNKGRPKGSKNKVKRIKLVSKKNKKKIIQESSSEEDTDDDSEDSDDSDQTGNDAPSDNNNNSDTDDDDDDTESENDTDSETESDEGMDANIISTSIQPRRSRRLRKNHGNSNVSKYNNDMYSYLSDNNNDNNKNKNTNKKRKKSKNNDDDSDYDALMDINETKQKNTQSKFDSHLY